MELLTRFLNERNLEVRQLDSLKERVARIGERSRPHFVVDPTDDDGSPAISNPSAERPVPFLSSSLSSAHWIVRSRRDATEDLDIREHFPPGNGLPP